MRSVRCFSVRYRVGFVFVCAMRSLTHACVNRHALVGLYTDTLCVYTLQLDAEIKHAQSQRTHSQRTGRPERLSHINTHSQGARTPKILHHSTLGGVVVAITSHFAVVTNMNERDSNWRLLYVCTCVC